MGSEVSPWQADNASVLACGEGQAVRLVRALRAELGTDEGTVHRVARQLGYGAESVRFWVRQADIDDGRAPGVSTTEAGRIAELEQENRELKRANEILKRAASFFGAELPTQEIVAFTDANCAEFGVEPIITTLASAEVKIAPSSYYAAKTRPPSARQQRDEQLTPQLLALWQPTTGSTVPRNCGRPARRDGHDIGRDRVARLMRAAGIQGVRRGRQIRTARPDPAAARHPARVKRNFTAEAPNQLWVTDLTYVPTWAGVAYVCFLVDVYSRMIVGWRVAGPRHHRQAPLGGQRSPTMTQRWLPYRPTVGRTAGSSSTLSGVAGGAGGNRPERQRPPHLRVRQGQDDQRGTGDQGGQHITVQYRWSWAIGLVKPVTAPAA